MTNNDFITCKPLFGEDIGLPKELSPDSFLLSKTAEYSRPSCDFVISRGKGGDVVSKYGDDCWDLSSYRQSGVFCSSIIHFEKLPCGTNDSAKWLVFVLLYMADTGRATSLSVSSIMDYMKVIRVLSEYADNKGVNLFFVLSDERLLMGFINKLNNKSLLVRFRSMVSQLARIGLENSDIKVLSGVVIEKTQEKERRLGEGKQHPVIPPRLFSELITQLDDFLDLIYKSWDDLEGFLIKLLQNKRFGRSESKQHKMGVSVKDYEPFFVEASSRYNLNNLFFGYGVASMQNLSTFLCRIQHACRMYIYIYSAMRQSEGLSLKVGCLVSERHSGIEVYRINAFTSKFTGQQKKVSWVTSKEIKKALEIAEKLAIMIGSHVNLDRNETPLFISPSYFGFTGTHKRNGGIVNVSSGRNAHQEIYHYLDMSKFIIAEEDSNYLEKIDSHRSWQEEDEFKIGVIWRFTTHQFRRSLAYYVLESGLVSLPSLKRQLKHLTREMTIYYCRSTKLEETFDSQKHIAKMIRSSKPEADAMLYIYEVILSDTTLYGGHGQFVERHVRAKEGAKVFGENRTELKARFKKGEMAYEVTPLGACTTIEPCDKKATREIAACVECDKSVIKLSKLNSVIERQEFFVDELKSLDKDSTEYRMEQAELNMLTDFREKIMVKEGG